MKHVYSLMLDDGVVAAIDRIAYQSGTNRSGMINSILAQYASYTTPEERIRRAFAQIVGLVGGVEGLLLATPPSDTLLSLRSALVYKYNPTVKYSVQLYRTQEDGAGELRVSLRTQNSMLIELMMRFFCLWNDLERRHIGECDSAAVDGKYIRRLVPRDKNGARITVSDPVQLGDAITAYIRAFDGALKSYFRLAEDESAALHEIEAGYLAHLSDGELIL